MNDELERALENLGTATNRDKLIAYTRKWILSTQRSIKYRSAQPSRAQQRGLAQKIGTDLRRIAVRIEQLPPDARFILSTALRARGGPDIQEGHANAVAKAILGWGDTIERAATRKWPEERNDAAKMLVYMVAAEYHKRLQIYPSAAIDSRFFRFAQAALDIAAPGTGKRSIAAAVGSWRADNPAKR